VVAAALSAIVPGLGQIAAGHRRRGWWFIGLTALFVVPAAVLFVMVFYVTGIGLAIDISRPFFRNPDLLLALLAANAASLAFRVMAAVDAYLLAAGPGRRGRVATGVTVAGLALVLLLTAVPHVWVGHRNLLLHDLLTHDFATDPNQAATTTITTTPPTTVPAGISTTTAAPTTTTAAPTTTTTTRPDPFADGDRVNVLLLGSDAGIGRTGVRTDTMIVLSVDPETGWTAMFGIPRNFIRLPIPPDHPAYPLWPDGVWGDPSNLAWGVYAYGLNNPELFAGANTGGDAAKTILGNLLGLIALAPLAWGQNSIENVGVTQSGGQILVRVTLKSPLAAAPGNFTIARLDKMPPGEFDAIIVRIRHGPNPAGILCPGLLASGYPPRCPRLPCPRTAA